MSLLDLVRTQAHRSITTPMGDGVLPLRVSKDLLRRANVLLGQPLCTPEALEERRSAAAKLAELRRARAVAGGRPQTAAPPRVQAPVTIYFEKDRNDREVRKIEQLLSAKSIEAKKLDVSGDENTLAFVLRTARVDADQLPVVFVTDRAIGGYNALVDADVSGRLEREVFPS